MYCNNLHLLFLCVHLLCIRIGLLLSGCCSVHHLKCHPVVRYLKLAPNLNFSSRL